MKFFMTDYDFEWIHQERIIKFITKIKKIKNLTLKYKNESKMQWNV